MVPFTPAGVTDTLGRLVGDALSRKWGQLVVVVAVSGASSSPSLPDVPNYQESGLPGLQTSTWFPLLGPKGMAPEMVASIQRDVAEVLSDPSVREKLLAQGVEPSGETAAALRARIERDSAQWKRVIVDARITL